MDSGVSSHSIRKMQARRISKMILQNTQNKAKLQFRIKKSSQKPLNSLLQLHRNIGNPAVGTIQTKLTIGQPDDKYEQEADRIADQVMRMSET